MAQVTVGSNPTLSAKVLVTAGGGLRWSQPPWLTRPNSALPACPSASLWATSGPDPAVLFGIADGRCRESQKAFRRPASAHLVGAHAPRSVERRARLHGIGRVGMSVGGTWCRQSSAGATSSGPRSDAPRRRLERGEVTWVQIPTSPRTRHGGQPDQPGMGPRRNPNPDPSRPRPARRRRRRRRRPRTQVHPSRFRAPVWS